MEKCASIQAFIDKLASKSENLMEAYEFWGMHWYESGDAETDMEIAFVDCALRYALRTDLREGDLEKIAELGKQLALSLEFHAPAIPFKNLCLKMRDIIQLQFSDPDIVFLIGY